MVDYDSPDIASEIDRHRLAAYERLQAINADLLAALEEIERDVRPATSSCDDRAAKSLFQFILHTARAAIAKAKAKE